MEVADEWPREPDASARPAGEGERPRRRRRDGGRWAGAGDKGAPLRSPCLRTGGSEDAARGASVGLSVGAGAAVGHGREGLSTLCP